jgi:hypothetical protein
MVYRALHSDRYPNGRCSAADDQFIQRLADDVMATTAPDGMTVVSTRRLLPCEDHGDSEPMYYGGVEVAWAYPAVPPPSAAIQSFYRTLGQANGWTIAAVQYEIRLPGCKVIDGTTVSFRLTTYDDEVNGRPVYWVELSYHRLHDPSWCG